jgi:hypothetical protein
MIDGVYFIFGTKQQQQQRVIIILANILLVEQSSAHYLIKKQNNNIKNCRQTLHMEDCLQQMSGRLKLCPPLWRLMINGV